MSACTHAMLKSALAEARTQLLQHQQQKQASSRDIAAELSLLLAPAQPAAVAAVKAASAFQKQAVSPMQSKAITRAAIGLGLGGLGGYAASRYIDDPETETDEEMRKRQLRYALIGGGLGAVAGGAGSYAESLLSGDEITDVEARHRAANPGDSLDNIVGAALGDKLPLTTAGVGGVYGAIRAGGGSAKDMFGGKGVIDKEVAAALAKHDIKVRAVNTMRAASEATFNDARRLAEQAILQTPRGAAMTPARLARAVDADPMVINANRAWAANVNEAARITQENINMAARAQYWKANGPGGLFRTQSGQVRADPVLAPLLPDIKGPVRRSAPVVMKGGLGGALGTALGWLSGEIFHRLVYKPGDDNNPLGGG